MKQQLYDSATCFDEPALAEWLLKEAKFEQAKHLTQQRLTLGRKTCLLYTSRCV